MDMSDEIYNITTSDEPNGTIKSSNEKFYEQDNSINSLNDENSLKIVNLFRS